VKSALYLNNNGFVEQEEIVESLIERFRGNFVIHSGEPYEEEKWDTIVIGDIPFQVCFGLVLIFE